METNLDDNISTSDQLNNIQFSDIFNLEDIQRLQDLFADANGVASIITHVDGTPITNPSNFTRLCTDIIRKTEKGCANCLKSDATLGIQSSSGPVLRQCLSGGLWEAGARITVGGRHLANWIIGQVRNDEVDIQHLITYADEIGVNREDFLDALYEVPVMSVDQLTKLSKMLFAVATEHSEKAYSNWLLKLQLTEQERVRALLKDTEKGFQLLFDKAPFAYQSLDFDGNLIEVNQQWLDILGYTRQEINGKWFGNFLSPPYQEDFRKQFLNFKAEGKIHSEFEMVHKNGNLSFITFDGTIGYDFNGFFKQSHCLLQDITERKQVEELIHENERSLKEAQHLAQIGSWTWAKSTDTMKWSEELYHIHRVNPNSAISGLAELSSHFTPESWKRLKTAIGKALQSGEPWELDLEIVLPDNSTRHTISRGEASYDATGKFTGLHGTVQDITERKLAEVVMHDFEEKLNNVNLYARSLIEASLDPMMTINLEGKITDVNAATERATGLTRNDLIGTEISNYFIETDQTRILYKKVMHEGYISDYPLTIHHTSNKLIDVLVNASIYRDKHRRILGVFVAARDITRRKLIDKKLRKSEERLNEAQRIAHVGNWEINLVTNKLIWSDEIFRILEIDPTVFGATNEAFQNAIHPEDRDAVDRVYFNSLETRSPYEITYRLLMPDGRVKYVTEVGETFYNDSGKAIRSVGTVQDITLSKQSDLLHQEKNEELLKLNADKDLFLSILAHDLKSPFNAILGFMELLTSNIREYDINEIERDLKIVDISVKRAYYLLEDILLWARSQMGKIPYEPQKLNFSAICQKILSDMKLIADTKKITIKLHAADETTVFADNDMLKTILRNLISNAIKYCNPGGRIEINTERTISEITISVSDNGIGIAPEIVNKLFDISKLHSTRGTADEIGTGLGLFLIKEFVEKHGGKIWVKSKLQNRHTGKVGGSTFYFTLPSLVEPEEIFGITNAIWTDKENDQNQENKLKILIADDDEVSGMLLTTFVEKIGKKIISAKNGSDVVEACLDNPDLDLVLLDIRMPEMDGYEAARQIRLFNPDVVIIAQTAFARNENREKAIKAGCNDYISKPIKREKLLSLVEKYCEYKM